jgi:hypothetical protein
MLTLASLVLAILQVSIVGGIRPLDELRLAEAMAEQSMKTLHTSVASLRLESLSISGRQDESLLTALETAPYRVYIETPYTRAARAAIDARRRFIAAPKLDYVALNSQKIIITVTPIDGDPAKEVDSFVLRQSDGTVVRPLIQSGLVDRSVSADGIAYGRFFFEIEALNSERPLDFVVIGKAANFEIRLTPAELARLK